MPSTAADPARIPTTTAPVFFVDTLEPGAADVLLDGAQGRHAAVVRRLGIGEALRISDGDGNAVDGRVVEVLGQTLRIEVQHRIEVAARPGRRASNPVACGSPRSPMSPPLGTAARS